MLPIIQDGNREVVTFTSKEDVWNVIDLLIKEINENNQKGRECDMAESINAQLPFFCCRNIIFEKEIQRDILRYIYCTNNNVPPYEGGYDKQPALWVDRYFIIKNALAKKEKASIEKTKKDK